MSFFRKIFRFKATSEIPELTEFLSKNETFKKTAKKIHTKKVGFWNSLDSYLEKELLDGKNVPKGPPKRIDSINSNNSSIGKK
ncbi:UNKNOWN [Stylonychia lemnae]|uniref:Uncharacterized protein n=1 Tax=Stylonychia lemnae TaxID=5949 RepID=A0A077ZY77_STYLE|nr:UNKNOWN [Stylonychia lemnae]|eukprot:CDW74836.1 UNKNOWN [Stylonychia lemnae]